VESNRRNYYRILHVQPDAPEAVIRASYRTIMQRLRAHPDLGGDHRAATLLNEAYAVLTDPTRRAAYDADLQPRRRPRTGAGHDARTGEAPPAGVAPAAPRVCAFCHRPDGRAPRTDLLCVACGSPLQPTGPATTVPRGRELPRFDRQQHATIFTRWPQARGEAAELRDLSPLGVRFLTPVELATGAVIKLDSEAFRAVARVTRVHRDAADGRWSVGGAFVAVLFSEPRGGFVSLRA